MKTTGYQFFINHNGKLIPFQFYTKSVNDYEGKYFIDTPEEMERMENRWRMFYRLGKKFVANEGTENEVECTPNDVVAVSYTISSKRFGLMCICGMAVAFLCWMIGFVMSIMTPETKQDFWNYGLIGWMTVGAGFVAVFCAFFGLAKLAELGNRKAAKKWNDVKIPMEQQK